MRPLHPHIIVSGASLDTELTGHLLLVPKLRMRGAIPPLTLRHIVVRNYLYICVYIYIYIWRHFVSIRVA